MKQLLVAAAIIAMSTTIPCKAQTSENEVADSVRKQLRTYVETFNKRDAKNVAAHWTS